MQSPFFLTIQLVIGATVLAGTFGTIGAWAASALTSFRSGYGEQRSFVAHSVGILVLLFRWAMVTSIAIPLVLHAAAWESAAGKFGWLSMTQSGARSAGAMGGFLGTLVPSGALSGLAAPIWVHGVHGIAIVAMAVWMGTNRLPAAQLRQAQMDFSVFGRWWRVQLPSSVRWLVAAVLIVALLAVTEMTVVDLYGVQTLADEFYLYFAAAPTAKSMAKVCVAPLVVGVMLWIAIRFASRGDHQNRSLGNSVSLDRRSEFVERPGGASVLVAAFVALSFVGLVVGVPLGSLIVKAGHTVVQGEGGPQITWTAAWFVETIGSAPKTFRDEYFWTALVGVLGGGIATVIAWAGVAAAEGNSRVRSAMDFIAALLFMIPGPIVGLLVVRFFQLPVPGFETVYQQTLLPTLIAVQFRAATIAYWLFRALYYSIGDSVFRSARLEFGLLGRWWKVDRPLVGVSALAIFGAASVVAAGDVPVMLPLLPPEVTTVSTRLFSLLHSGSRYQEASLAFWYLVALLVIMTVAIILTRRPTRNAG